MDLIFAFLSVFCLIVVQGHASIQTSLDCSQYSNDTEVIRSLPFHVSINSNDGDNTGSFAIGYANGIMKSLILQKVTFIPSTIFCLKEITQFDVRYSSFCENQSSICQLSSEIERWNESLRSIYIYNTKITHLPTSFAKLKQLRNLRLINTDLLTLPNTFSSLPKLDRIQIASNSMTILPKSIGMLTSLKTLYLDNSTNLRSIQSLNGMKTLNFLSAINCSITSIPIKLPRLIYMDLANNKLTNLNLIQTLGFQTDMAKFFSFNDNQIQTLPSEFVLANNIARIFLSNNKLKTLPSTIFDYKPLVSLSIENNLFSSTTLNNTIEKFKITNPEMHLIY